MSQQIFVVEGRNDVSKLKQIFPNINVVSINGSEIDLEVIEYLKNLKNYEIILVLDPDYMGLQIRKKLEEYFPNASHIFIERKKAYSKNRKKIGLEHLSNEDIKNLFENIYHKNENHNNVKLKDLYQYHLVGQENSRVIREEFCSYFKLGFSNGKTLLKRINESNLTIEEINNYFHNK